jgi:hypothetical protein
MADVGPGSQGEHRRLLGRQGRKRLMRDQGKDAAMHAIEPSSLSRALDRATAHAECFELLPRYEGTLAGGNRADLAARPAVALMLNLPRDARRIACCRLCIWVM